MRRILYPGLLALALLALTLGVAVPVRPSGAGPRSAEPGAGEGAGILPPAAWARPGRTPGQAAGGSPGGHYGRTGPGGRPTTPSPWLAFLPAGADPDRAAWEAYLRERSAETRRERRDEVRALALDVPESEDPDRQNGNDTLETADPVPGFGTAEGEQSETRLTGTLAPPAATTSITGPEPTEDDGAIPLATDTGLSLHRELTVTGEVVGDGPHSSGGTGTGDFDLYRVDAPPGARLIVDVETPDPRGDLDPVVALYRRTGPTTADLVAVNNDEGPQTFDSLLSHHTLRGGEYHVSVGGFGSFLLQDPFDPASGLGAASEGDYDLTLSVVDPDVDVFSVELAAGDVLGATIVSGDAERITALAADGSTLMSSAQDLSPLYPRFSPLEGGGPHAAVVAEGAGTHGVAVTGAHGAYEVALQVLRPGTERLRNGRAPRVFLDFDGATLRGPSLLTAGASAPSLSPLSTFLDRWGLDRGDEDAVIDAVVAAVRDNLDHDLRGAPNGDFDASGSPGDFGVEILTSRDHPDPTARLDTTRIVVGGTIGELGLPTIGIAESIDPGNFAPAETGIVLLDELSGACPNPNSLNCVPLTGDATRIDLVGTAVGNIAAHEAGHLLGGLHTDQSNDVPELMDQGGNLPNTIGLGPDGAFGGVDDVDVDFGEDAYVPNERLIGLEDTRALAAHDQSTGTDPHNDPPVATRDVFPFPGGPVRIEVPGILANDHDPEFDPLTARLVRAPRLGAIEAFGPDGSFTLVPTAVRDITFTYRVSDGDLVSDPVTVTVAVRDCATRRDLRNGSFELRLDFWCVHDIRGPTFPLRAVPAGVSTDFGEFGFFATAPTDGDLVALHGFDGAGPGTIELVQFVRPRPVPTGAQLTFDWRAAWDLVTFCEGCTGSRTFEVLVEDALTGTDLRRQTLLVADPGTSRSDTGPQTASLALEPLSGAPLRIALIARVPEAYTGPGQIQIDDVVLGPRSEAR